MRIIVVILVLCFGFGLASYFLGKRRYGPMLLTLGSLGIMSGVYQLRVLPHQYQATTWFIILVFALDILYTLWWFYLKPKR